jgi:hypothetical protein
MFAGLLMIATSIEWLVWVAICTGLLLGLLLRIGGGGAMHHVISRLKRRLSHSHLAHPHVAALLLASSLAAAVAIPTPARGQGWWWGSPINPGFDRNTVIQVTGKVTQVNIVPRGGPSTLRLETIGETFTVMLAPGWYLAELHADIRSGDVLTVEGSKMMDRWGQLHLAAARIAISRTSTVLELRDETGRPRWMGGPSGPPGR